jgi:hypothetical protein
MFRIREPHNEEILENTSLVKGKEMKREKEEEGGKTRFNHPGTQLN